MQNMAAITVAALLLAVQTAQAEPYRSRTTVVRDGNTSTYTTNSSSGTTTTTITREGGRTTVQTTKSPDRGYDTTGRMWR